MSEWAHDQESSLAEAMFLTKFSLAKGVRSKNRSRTPLSKNFRSHFPYFVEWHSFVAEFGMNMNVIQ